MKASLSLSSFMVDINVLLSTCLACWPRFPVISLLLQPPTYIILSSLSRPCPPCPHLPLVLPTDDIAPVAAQRSALAGATRTSRIAHLSPTRRIPDQMDRSSHCGGSIKCMRLRLTHKVGSLQCRVPEFVPVNNIPLALCSRRSICPQAKRESTLTPIAVWLREWWRSVFM